MLKALVGIALLCTCIPIGVTAYQDESEILAWVTTGLFFIGLGLIHSYDDEDF